MKVPDMVTDLEFDYVIVGGVFAARLAAESDGATAQLERGQRDTNRWIHIPASFFKALRGQESDAVVSKPDIGSKVLSNRLDNATRADAYDLLSSGYKPDGTRAK